MLFPILRSCQIDCDDRSVPNEARLKAETRRLSEETARQRHVPLCSVGVYFVRGNPFDLMVMGCAGILGFVLRRQGRPMAPLVIGMVLGPTLEISLRQGLIITDGSFLAFFSGHPIALVLAGCAVGMLSLPVITAARAKRTTEDT